mgnify:CR=1 FL=1
MKKYKILITPRMGAPYEIELETDRLEWSMEQYQRNRDPLTWKVLSDG